MKNGAFFSVSYNFLKMKKWAEPICEQLHSRLEGTKDSDLRFFRIAEFERMIKRTGDFAEKCSYCRELKPEIESMVSEIDKAIHSPGKLRRKYDRLTGRIAKHQKEHGYYPPYFFTYHYSFVGIIGGSLLGTILGRLIMPEALVYFAMSGFAVGIITAQIWGGIKDRRIRGTGKLL